MVRNIIAKNLGKISLDEIYPHKNVNISKGPDGLNIRGNIYIDNTIGIGTEYTHNNDMRIVGNVEIQAKSINNTILNIKNNLNNIIFTINNSSVNIYNNLNSSNIEVNNILKIPVYDNVNTNTTLLNQPGSIIFNTSSNMYEGFDNNKWSVLGGTDNLVNILNVSKGGTGLNILGGSGQILQVKEDLSGLKWITPTAAIVAPQNYKILESLTGLYDNRSIKNYNLVNPGIQLINNYYEWTAITNYLPPTNTKQIIFNFDFSLYDTNLNTSIKIEYIINNLVITKQTNQEKLLSGNQQKNIQKTLIINLEDNSYKDLDWTSNNNVKVKITDIYNTNNIILFTYDGININYPKISIHAIGIDDGNISIQQNLSIDSGSINNTIIGQNIPTSASFTNINCNNIISNNITITNPLSINNGGTGLNTIGTSGQVLYVNSSENGLEWKMIPQRSLQSNQILENLVGIYDNRIVKTYTLSKPSITILSNTYEWIAITNYMPPTNTKQIIFNFDFSLYDTNLNTSIKIEYKIGNNLISDQTIEEKLFSAGQQKNILKKLIINLEDNNYKDLNWTTPEDVKIKFTDIYDTNNIKLFTYDGININYPKISIQAIGNNLGDISINQNLTINEGIINNTVIGEIIPTKAYFTDVYVDGTLVHFTGSHLNKFSQTYNTNYIGCIVVSSGIFSNKPTINKSLPTVDLSSTKQSKNVYGVIACKYDSTQIVINSVGEGGIWVVNTNGNLQNGDYIQTSNILGLGEKQVDNLLYNYTVAKILHDCNFNINNNLYDSIQFTDTITDNIYIKSFVGCTYHCG
jgi:hypothetical protein